MGGGIGAIGTIFFGAIGTCLIPAEDTELETELDTELDRDLLFPRPSLAMLNVPLMVLFEIEDARRNCWVSVGVDEMDAEPDDIDMDIGRRLVKLPSGVELQLELELDKLLSLPLAPPPTIHLDLLPPSF